jgi:hypothetical protein
LLNARKFLIHLIDFRLNEIRDFLRLGQAFVVGEANIEMAVTITAFLTRILASLKW